MAQQPDDVRREAALHGVRPALPQPDAPPRAPDEFNQAAHFVFLAVVLYLLQPVWTSLALSALRDSGFYAWYYGPGLVAAAVGPASPAQQVAHTRLQLWALAAGFPFWLASAVLLIRLLPAAYRRDLGVSLGRYPGAPGANVLLGVAASLLI